MSRPTPRSVGPTTTAKDMPCFNCGTPWWVISDYREGRLNAGLREAAQRLCNAIANESAVKGLAQNGFPQGWKAEWDAEAATLCALQDTRMALDGRERPHVHVE